MLIDCHVHTRSSPGGEFSPRELVCLARERGLDGICITDTHQVAVALEARRLGQELGLLVLAGFEAETDQGHFLVFLPRPDELPPISGWLRTGDSGVLSFVSLAEAVRARAGLLVAAHPFDRQRPGSSGDRLARLAEVGGIEVLNARASRLANEMAEEMAASLGLAGLGGSDTRADAERLGQVATLLGGPVADEAQFIEHLRQADAWPVELVEPPAAPSRRRSGKKPHPRGEQRKRSPRPRRQAVKPAAGKRSDTGKRPRRRRRGPRQRPPQQ